MNKVTMTTIATGTLAVLLPLAMLMPQELTLPAHDDEVETAVTLLLEQDRRDEAVEMLAAWMVRDDQGRADGQRCGFCVAQLKKVGTSASGDETVRLLLDAMARAEGRAVDAGDGARLLRLASLSMDTQHSPSIDRGLHYLVEAFRAGNFGGADARMSVVPYLAEYGRTEDALALAQQVHDDPASPLFESEVTQRWINRLEFEVERRDALTDRLLALGTGGTSRNEAGDYLPIVKTAPRYPVPAVAQRLEGDVIVEYTVGANGKTKDPFIVSSTSALFDKPSLESVLDYLYMPRVVSGVPVEVSGVRTKITYRLE